MTDEAFTKQDIIHIQRPNSQRSPAEFDHVKRDLKGAEEDTSVIRNSNHTLDKVLAQQGKAPQPTSKRELAVAQLEAALRKKRLAKSKTASHHTGELLQLYCIYSILCARAMTRNACEIFSTWLLLYCVTHLHLAEMHPRG